MHDRHAPGPPFAPVARAATVAPGAEPVASASARQRAGTFPTGAGLLFGLGLGGFFDGIVLHQLLQWHHMLSSWYPTDTLENLRLNTLWDGIFHSLTYVFVVGGLWRFWRVAHRGHLYWSGRLMGGMVLLGWGVFNVVEGLVDHELLGIHHVNERVPVDQWVAWDLGFLAWGAAMVVIGGWLYRTGRRRQSAEMASDRGLPADAAGSSPR